MSSRIFSARADTARYLGALFAAVAWSLAPVRAWGSSGDNLLTGYSLTSWTDGDSSPLGTVYAMVQDPDGYLWIGADAGLFRFDGSRFTRWEPVEGDGLPHSPIFAICPAKDGGLWIAFAGGVRQVRDGRLGSVARDHDPLASVTDLIEARGALWAVNGGELFKRTGDGWRKLRVFQSGREPVVQHPFVRRNGELWIATSRGLFRHLQDSDTFERVTAGFIWGMSEDRAGDVWITDIVAGFRRLNDPPAPRREVEGAGYRLMNDRAGNLWVATLGEGLWRSAADGSARQTIERTALRTGLSSDSVQSLLEDREGNIWVGTTGGLHRLTRRKLTPVEDAGFVVTIEAADSPNMWAGTTNGLLHLSSASDGWQRHQNESGPDVRMLHRDAHGTVWIGTNTALWRYERGAFARVPLPPDAPMPIISIGTDPHGVVWLGNGLVVSRWDGTRLERYDVPDPKKSPVVLSQMTSEGTLWLAFADGRIGVIDAEGHFRTVGPAEGLPDGTHRSISAFFEDSQHVMWIGGSGGLSRFADGRFVTVRHAQGLPGARVLSVVDDADGNLWITVDRGLVRLSRQTFIHAAADPSTRIEYRMYDTSDGLAGAPLGAVRSARAGDGKLWFVRGGGLTVVDPRVLGDDLAAVPAPVRVEAVVANDRTFGPERTISLPAGTRRLQISYTAVTLTSPNKIRFRYRLDGFDTDWIDAGPRRQAFYTNLSPRDYRFRVEAEAEDGTWRTSAASWGFAILPAFYQTSWFYALSVVSLALAVWGFWRMRLQIVRREFSLVLAERARLSREVHDTLLQSLVGVALQFDGISNSLDGSAAAAKAQLVRIRRQVEAYIREARQSIWDLRSPVLETHDLATALREFGRRAAAGQPVRFVSTVTGTPRQCPAKVENQLLRIGQEAITNAVRHAGAKRIQLELQFDESSLRLRVSDDGQGFNDALHSHNGDGHYGLTMMRERAEELGAQFTIVSTAGRGTDVETVVPLPAR
jgi:signal transduction histidine kinase/ligand-binding sensor domain-containing protein